MVQAIPNPEPQVLLPPLLACLPTAFVSPRPAPALLPLLSPILRQRVQLLSADTTRQDSWIPLLCWDASKAARLPEVIADNQFEPHPVSGEVEIDHPPQLLYRRLDEETLQAKLPLPDRGLDIRYVWCVDDQVGGGDGWRVGELSLYDEGNENSVHWHPSVDAAYNAYTLATVQDALQEGAVNGSSRDRAGQVAEGEEDDDAYWQQYDATPSRTPGRKISPAPPVPTQQNSAHEATDDAYYAQYSHVQPAMDEDDPAERSNGLVPHRANGAHLQDARPREMQERGYESLSHPRPASSSSSASETISRLEDNAAAQTESDLAIRQHIGTSLKSLYRLSKAAGIERREFERLVRTELRVLGMMDDEEL
ncbi:MAG: hypothetical protein M1838_000079 [Thelocarpon superellum]|nr:MAG: hypothetical protein M1838_000079 [Thelocarpon superellum]